MNNITKSANLEGKVPVRPGLRLSALLCLFFVAWATFSIRAEETHFMEEDIESPNEAFLRGVKKLKPKKLADLIYLSPFSDISVIQRRFMPKTGRVSATLASVFALSSEFFLHTGGEGHLTYHFLEKHAIEFSGYYVFHFMRGVTSDLQELKVNVLEQQPMINSFFGLTYKWMPVYGKIAFNNKNILAFDTFFNLGLGMSGVNIKKKVGKTTTTQLEWGPTALIGVGQVFAISRDLGLRWDLRWHWTYELKGQSFLDNILFSMGLSYYYPSAGLR